MQFKSAIAEWTQINFFSR